MAKFIKAMTQDEVDAIVADGAHSVGGVPGLRLQVKGKARSWVLRRTSEGKARDIGIGSCSEVTLQQARDIAEAKRKGRVVSAPWAARVVRDNEEIGRALKYRIFELLEPHLQSAIWLAIDELIASEAA